MELRAIIRVDFGAKGRLGPGKTQLLELIGETGSISGAARRMEMSYRRAWLLVDELNELFGKPVVETMAGGAGGGGATVTDFGRQVVRAFREMESQANELAKVHMTNLKQRDT